MLVTTLVYREYWKQYFRLKRKINITKQLEKKLKQGRLKHKIKIRIKTLESTKKAMSINIQLIVITLGIYELNSLNDINQINGQRN